MLLIRAVSYTHLQELDGIIDKIIGYFRFHDRKERDDETDMWERINREIRQHRDCP